MLKGLGRTPFGQRPGSGGLGQVQLVLQPDGKIVGVELEAEPGIDKVVVNSMDADFAQPVGKFFQVARNVGPIALTKRQLLA